MEINIDPVLKDAENVSRRNHAYLVHHYLYESLASAAARHAKGRVLDIGCGYKPYQKLFDKLETVTDYTGCDVRQTDKNTVDIVCAAEKIPLPDNSMDTILCTQVIEHIFDSGPVLREAYRLLAPDGRIIISAPLYWPEHGEPLDYFRFTRFGLKEVLHRTGFRVLEILENGGAWAVAGQALAHAVDFSKKRAFFFRLTRFLFIRLRLLSLSNSIFKWMDKKDHNPENTINYVVVAIK